MSFRFIRLRLNARHLRNRIQRRAKKTQETIRDFYKDKKEDIKEWKNKTPQLEGLVDNLSNKITSMKKGAKKINSNIGNFKGHLSKKLSTMKKATVIKTRKIFSREKTDEKALVKSVKKSASKMEFSDYSFLLSLLPYLENVSEDRKMFVRMKMQGIFVDEETFRNVTNSQKPCLPLTDTRENIIFTIEEVKRLYGRLE